MGQYPIPVFYFMKVTKNIVKGIITSSIGVATMVITLFLIFTKSMDFVWGGLAGLTMGTILLLAPDTLVKKLGDVIRAIGLNKSGADANAQEQIQENKVDPPTNG